MAITVTGVPTSRKTPGIYVNVVPGSKGAGGTGQKNDLLIGQVLATGSMSAGEIETCESEAEAITLAGQGSELHLMARGYFNSKPNGTVSLGAVNAGATPSTRDLVFANAATADGSYTITIDGNTFVLDISNGDSIANMADNMADATTGQLLQQGWYGDLPITALSDGVDTVTFTTKNLGPQSQYPIAAMHDITTALPGTTTATLGAVNASGGADPSLTTAQNLLTAVAAGDYDYIGCSNIDAAAVTSIESHIDTQWAATIGKYEQWVLCHPSSTYATVQTFAQTTMNKEEMQLVWSVTNNETYYETIGRVVGLRSALEEVDPAQPYSNKVVPGYRVHQTPSSYPSAANIETGLNNSVTPIGVDGGNGVIVRSITSYSLNGSTPDESVLDTASVTVPIYMGDRFKIRMAADFADAKAAADYSDPTATPNGVVTPSMVIDVIYNEMKAAEGLAILSEITEDIKDMISAEYAGGGRINFECAVPVMLGLYIVAGNVRGV